MEAFFKTLEAHPGAALFTALVILAIVQIIRFKIEQAPEDY
ncbi:hypothetical protein [Leeuwenhoekiella sp. LLG6367-2.1]